MLFGTSKSIVFAFDLQNNEVRIVSRGGPVKNERVERITIAETGDYVIIGYEMGMVTIIDMKTKEVLKSIGGVFLSSVCIIKILSVSGYSFVAADPSGMLIQFSLKREMFGWGLDTPNFIFQKGSSKHYLTS
jgi:hypothetical protein